MSALTTNILLIFNAHWTHVHHVLKVGALIDFVDFILDNTGLILSLLTPKPLVSVCKKDESLFIFLIPPPRVSIILDLHFLVITNTPVMTHIIYQNHRTGTVVCTHSNLYVM